MVVDAGTHTARQAEVAERMVRDMQRLHGPMRISVRATPDGLGIFIPPRRSIGPVVFLVLWMCGWGAGEYFALGEMLRGGIALTDLFLLIWVVPWTIAGLAVLRVILWQIFGQERLYFTAGALVRERTLMWRHGRRTVMGGDIVSVKADSAANDLFGLGTVTVETGGRRMRIGSGLDAREAELVAELIRGHAREGSPAQADGFGSATP